MKLFFRPSFKVDEKIKDKKELEKIILCDVQIEIYSDIREITFRSYCIILVILDVKFEKKIDFEQSL